MHPDIVTLFQHDSVKFVVAMIVALVGFYLMFSILRAMLHGYLLWHYMALAFVCFIAFMMLADSMGRSDGDQPNAPEDRTSDDPEETTDAAVPTEFLGAWEGLVRSDGPRPVG